VARRRTTFGKLQRDREKQAKAKAKLERRAARAAEQTPTEEAPAGDVDQEAILAELADLHAAFDEGKMSLDDFETRRDELRSSLRVD
jgi:hypothetical protein